MGVHHSPDEEAAEEHRLGHLHQAPGGGEGEEGQLRPRRLRPRAGHHRGGRRDQGDAEDDGLPVHPWPPDDHSWRPWRQPGGLPGTQELDSCTFVLSLCTLVLSLCTLVLSLCTLVLTACTL